MSVRKTTQPSSKVAEHLRLKSLTDPAIKSYIEELRRQYGKYATSAQEVRETLDKTMGEKTLTDLLHEVREGVGHG